MNKPAGYYMDCLLACLDEVRDGHLNSDSKYVARVANFVLARAQRPLALPIGEYAGSVWDKTFDSLNNARKQVMRETEENECYSVQHHSAA